MQKYSRSNLHSSTKSSQVKGSYISFHWKSDQLYACARPHGYRWESMHSMWKKIWNFDYFWLSFARFILICLQQNLVQHMLEYVVLSVSPASIPKQKGYDMRQTDFAQHGTSAFMQAFAVVVHLKIDTHKNKILHVKKKKKNQWYWTATLSHTKHDLLISSF